MSCGCCFAALCLKSVGHTLRIKRLNRQLLLALSQTGAAGGQHRSAACPACRRGRAVDSRYLVPHPWLDWSFFKRPAKPLQQRRRGNSAAQAAAASRSGAAKDPNRPASAGSSQRGTRHGPKKGWAGLGGFGLAGLLGQGLRLQRPLSHKRPRSAVPITDNAHWACRPSRRAAVAAAQRLRLRLQPQLVLPPPRLLLQLLLQAKAARSAAATVSAAKATNVAVSAKNQGSALEQQHAPDSAIDLYSATEAEERHVNRSTRPRDEARGREVLRSPCWQPKS